MDDKVRIFFVFILFKNSIIQIQGNIKYYVNDASSCIVTCDYQKIVTTRQAMLYQFIAFFHLKPHDIMYHVCNFEFNQSYFSH